MSSWSNRKLALGQRSTSKKHTTLMSSKPEPAIWSRDTGQRIFWCDSCQLNIMWNSNINDICFNPRLHDLVLAVWPPCCATPSSFVVVGRTHQWSIIFQVVVVGRFHSITPSLLLFPLDIWKSGGGGGSSHMKRQGILVGKLEFNSCGRLMWTLPELHYTPKRYRLKQNRFDY